VTRTTAAAGPRTPAIYECLITHARAAPVRNVFSYHSYQWLVDIDELPRLRGGLRLLADFRAADHLGDPRRSIRENLEHFLATQGIDLAGGRVLMLTNARVLGYVFNPLTVYWCHGASHTGASHTGASHTGAGQTGAGGQLECVVAEVHNTYGQRHCYLLRTDPRGRAETAKEFYVSPYHGVDGRYLMSLPEPGARLALSIALHLPARPPFTASVRGRAVRADGAGLVAAAVRHPWSTAVVAGRIRWQGIKLYARGLRPRQRPERAPQEGVV
jgi:DUF1365 family protein